jgi:hypothetical protein
MGSKTKEIQIDLDITRGALRSTHTLEQLRPKGISQRKPGRPTTYYEADERNLLRHVRLHPKDTYKEVRVACGLSIKRDAIKKILKRHSIINWRARCRPFLTEANAAKRLVWCLKHRGIAAEEWGMYMWSDECSVERERGKRNEYVFGTVNQLWDREWPKLMIIRRT